MKNEIIERLIPILNSSIEDLEIDDSRYDIDLLELGMDSITFIHIIVSIEEEFKCEIPDENLLLREMNTVNKITDAIASVLEKTGSVSNE